MNMSTDQGRATGQSLSNGMLEDNYPRNMWWVAARGDEVGEKPLARWLLEKPVVLYRLKDGTPVALDDRCPHRCPPDASLMINSSVLITELSLAAMGDAPVYLPRIRSQIA